MCPGEQTKSNSSCNHSVKKDDVKQQMISLLLNIDILIKNEVSIDSAFGVNI